MARTIKKIAHDLLPLSDAITQLSDIISQQLESLNNLVEFKDPRIKEYFQECINAQQKMAASARLVREYVIEVNQEADSEGIAKA
jgi:tRNA uridine 5-carbamoylmethylation protein Kti12